MNGMNTFCDKVFHFGLMAAELVKLLDWWPHHFLFCCGSVVDSTSETGFTLETHQRVFMHCGRTGNHGIRSKVDYSLDPLQTVTHFFVDLHSC